MPSPRTSSQALPCMRLAPPPHPPPSRLPLCTSPTYRMTSLATRQGAPKFNQPLSFDISGVTSMGTMFTVHSARALPRISSRILSCMPIALAPNRPLLPVHASPSLRLGRKRTATCRKQTSCSSVAHGREIPSSKLVTVRRALHLGLHALRQACHRRRHRHRLPRRARHHQARRRRRRRSLASLRPGPS